MRKREIHRNTGLVWMLWIVLTLAASPDIAMGASLPLSYDFESGAGTGWSTPYTVTIDGNKVLGPFNDQALRHVRGTRLAVEGIPPNSRVNLSFDLYLIGTWDSEGKLADRFIISNREGKTVYELTTFPNKFRDKKEKEPVGNKGVVTVDGRKLAYWVVPQKVTVPPEQIPGGKLDLGFLGRLSGKSTEFWALDNVKISLEP